MKSRLPDDFIVFARQYTLSSMLKAVTWKAFDMFTHPEKSTLGPFAKRENSIIVAQTWLIDMVYELCSLEQYGSAEMPPDKLKILIGLFNDYFQKKEHTKYTKNDVWLYVYGFFGEQKRFQEFNYWEDYAREKYILDSISMVTENTGYNLDIRMEFKEETGLDSDRFLSILFHIISCFFCNNLLSMTELISYLQKKGITESEFRAVFERYTQNAEDVKKSKLQRQFFYSYPFIYLNGLYYASNPYLLFSLICNAYYWVLRNRFCKLKRSDFISSYGAYFEKYVNEIMDRCLPSDSFEKIPVSENQGDKRADWNIHLENYHILVEQKSTISVLTIKQSQPDIKEIKKHVIKVWGEAVEQLKNTEEALRIPNCIKMILVYDDYFKPECLEELFRLRQDLHNDGRYCLISIREFEMLMMLYSQDKDAFKIVMNNKIQAELTESKESREFSKFLADCGVNENQYLSHYGIYHGLKPEMQKLLKENNRGE